MDFLEKFSKFALDESENVIDLLTDYEKMDAVIAFESCYINDEFINSGVLEILERCENFNPVTDNYFYKDRFGYIHGLETMENVKQFYLKQVENMNPDELLKAIIDTDYSDYLGEKFTKLLDEYTGKERKLDISTLNKGDMFICDNVVYRIIGGDSCPRQALSLEKLDIYSLYHFRNKACYKVD